ncbi:MAG: HAD family hydrolase [Candidatus Omnitrophica bacterium]|nr:HAD family hydrolase [Candidatus Omnitrophota bacterium]
MLKKPARAIFLDRDGVINRSPGEGYVRSVKEFFFLPGALPALKRLAGTDFLLIVVSNQGGVSKKLYSRKDLQEITRYMTSAIRRAGGKLHQVFYCTHQLSEGCGCRKPKIGLIRQALKKYPIDLRRSYLIGDHLKDIQLGKAAGCTTLLALSGRTSPAQGRRFAVKPDHVCKDLKAGVRWILARGRSG